MKAPVLLRRMIRGIKVLVSRSPSLGKEGTGECQDIPLISLNEKLLLELKKKGNEHRSNINARMKLGEIIPDFTENYISDNFIKILIHPAVHTRPALALRCLAITGSGHQSRLPPELEPVC